MSRINGIAEGASGEQTLMERIISWRKQYITDRQFTLFLSFLVGFFAAIAAFILHWIIEEIALLLTSKFDANTFNWMYLVYPVIGIYLTSLFVRYIVKDEISHGITRILYAISSKRSRLKGHNCWSSVIASAITIGFGGSVGAEAPIVLTGSAIGSNLGKLFNMDNKTLMLLVGCGAAAAIAGIFKAPIAGLVFTLEVLMIDLTMASLLPILISSVTATCFTYIFTGSDPLFFFHLDSAWPVERVPANILLGIFGGFVSLYFIRTMTACESVFGRIKNRPMLKLLLGAMVLSPLIFLFPSLYGEGYGSINILLNGKTEAEWETILHNSPFYGNSEMLLPYIGMVLLTKVFATSATNGGGGCGGTFAPSLFIGAFAGFFFARVWNIYEIGIYLPEKNFALLGMSAVMAGVMHAPLTGIFLIAEITGGYQMFIPLMIVSICAYLTIIIFEPHSIYGMRLARQGKLITHHKDRAVLTLMSLDSVIDKSFTAVSPELNLASLVHAISKSHNNVLPVLDDAGNLLGEIDITKLRHIVFRTELYHHFKVKQLMSQPEATLSVNDTMEIVMKKFDQTDSAMLPVLDNENHLLGYISRTHMYTMYRKMVADLSED
ncbi:probable chloride channel protein [Prevotella sp. CAG:255]|nr:probable chloride channel protein [Prevotella sp. CAG:255]